MCIYIYIHIYIYKYKYTIYYKKSIIKKSKIRLAQALAQAARASPAARARDLRKELAQAHAQAARASKLSV